MNRSLQEKSASRLAAAQLLYQVALTDAAINAEKLMHGYSEQLAEEGKSAIRPNMAYLRKLLSGVAEHGEALEPWVDKMLVADWKKERMSPLLLAILRLGVFELAHFPELPAPVIISEYTGLSERFFGEAETGFVGAALAALARELRG